MHASFILDEFRLSLDQVTAFVLRKHKAGIRIASLFSRGDCPWWRWLLMRLWAFVLAAGLLKGLRERGKESVQDCTWPAGPIGPKRIEFTITSKYGSLSRLQTRGLG